MKLFERLNSIYQCNNMEWGHTYVGVFQDTQTNFKE